MAQNEKHTCHRHEHGDLAFPASAGTLERNGKKAARRGGSERSQKEADTVTGRGKKQNYEKRRKKRETSPGLGHQEYGRSKNYRVESEEGQWGHKKHRRSRPVITLSAGNRKRSASIRKSLQD